MTRKNMSKRLCGAALAAASLGLSLPVRAQHAQALTDQAPHSLTGVRFRFAADGPVRGGFALSGPRLLFGTETGSFYAIDARSGALAWRKRVRSPVLSTPAIAGSRAFFTTWDNVLHAIDASSGRALWSIDLGRTLGTTDYWEYYVSSPLIAGGRLYVGSGSGRLYAINPNAGKIVWSARLGARVRSTPFVGRSAVIVGTNGGEVVVVNRGDGSILWRFATEGAAHDFAFGQNDTRSVVTSPVIVGDMVIAGGRDGNIYGIDLRTGRERWRETHDGSSWILGLASDGARFYSGSGSALIVQAADPSTGKEAWRSRTGDAMFGGLAKAGDVLVSNGSSGDLFGLSAADGSILWRLKMPDMTLSSPLVAPGVVYTGSDDGSVFAFDTSESVPPKLERLVYGFTDEPAASAFWFKPGRLAAIRESFAASGYAALGNAELAKALAAPIGEKGRKIIILADTRLPDGLDGARLRSFLDHGGILVLIGPDPLLYDFDSSGAPVAIHPEREKAAYGIDPTDKERDYGYNVAWPTTAARALGLTRPIVASGWAQPAQVSVPLALDRSGMAAVWAKKYANGGMLIALPLPRYGSADLSTYVNAIELAASRSVAGLM